MHECFYSFSRDDPRTRSIRAADNVLTIFGAIYPTLTRVTALRQAANRAEAMQPEKGATLGGALAQYRRPNRRGTAEAPS